VNVTEDKNSHSKYPKRVTKYKGTYARMHGRIERGRKDDQK